MTATSIRLRRHATASNAEAAEVLNAKGVALPASVEEVQSVDLTQQDPPQTEGVIVVNQQEPENPADLEQSDPGGVETAEDAPKVPTRSASKTDWEAYAATQEFDTEGLTRDQIAEHFLGPKE